MNEPPDWMTPTDVLLIIAMGSSDVIQVYTPAVLAYNLGRGRENVTRRLAELVERGFATKVERGKYKLTERGRTFLAGELDASELESDNEG